MKRSEVIKHSRRNGEGRELLLEMYYQGDPEALMMLAEEAMKMLEDPECDEFLREAARGLLVMSSVIYKFWRFYMPPYVELEFVFDNQQRAEEFAEKVGKFMKVRKASRTIDGKTYPSVRVDWMQWHSMKMAVDAPIEPPDIIAENFMEQKNPRKALQRLIEDTMLFSMATETDLNIVEDQRTKPRRRQTR